MQIFLHKIVAFIQCGRDWGILRILSLTVFWNFCSILRKYFVEQGGTETEEGNGVWEENVFKKSDARFVGFRGRRERVEEEEKAKK